MSGFNGLEEAKVTLRRLQDKNMSRIREEKERKRSEKRDKRWIAGGATIDEMEEFYQEQRGKFSEAYFSGSPFYVGTSFKDWYLSSGQARPDLSEALVLGAMLTTMSNKFMERGGEDSGCR